MSRTVRRKAEGPGSPPPGEHRCKRLVGKRAIVTAATRGIGLAIAQRLAEEGAEVMICSRRKRHVQEAVRTLRSKGNAVHDAFFVR